MEILIFSANAFLLFASQKVTDHMSHGSQSSNAIRVHPSSLWWGAVGFLLIAIGSAGIGWFPEYDRFNFVLQAVGPVLIALTLIITWRAHVQRRGRAALIFYVVAILGFGAIWIPYVIDPASLGTSSANQLGFITSGCASICASIATFLVMKRKEAQLEHPINSVEPKIQASFMQLLFFGVGTLLYGVDFVWVGEENSNHAQFSLLVIALLLILIAAISFEACMTKRVGRPAFFITIAGLALYVLNFALHALPSWSDEDWRISLAMQSIAYALGGLAFALAATHKEKSS